MSNIVLDDTQLARLWTKMLNTFQLRTNTSLECYPVGAFYISYNSTSPASLFGGTWTQVGGVFLGAYQKGLQYFGAIHGTGGEILHTLTNDEIPNHGQHLYDDWMEHGNATSKYLGEAGISTYGSATRGWNTDYGGEYYPAGQNIGGGLAHNNMPPYLIVYMWRRTA